MAHYSTSALSTVHNGQRKSGSLPLGAAIFLTLSLAPLSGQVGTSTLTGRIADASNAVIPDVEVKVINEGSGAALSVRTNSEGIYRGPP